MREADQIFFGAIAKLLLEEQIEAMSSSGSRIPTRSPQSKRKLSGSRPQLVTAA
jgi:hypothetical protein